MIHCPEFPVVEADAFRTVEVPNNVNKKQEIHGKSKIPLEISGKDNCSKDFALKYVKAAINNRRGIIERTGISPEKANRARRNDKII